MWMGTETGEPEQSLHPLGRPRRPTRQHPAQAWGPGLTAASSSLKQPRARPWRQLRRFKGDQSKQGSRREHPQQANGKYQESSRTTRAWGLPPWLPIKPHKHPAGRGSTGALHRAALPREGQRWVSQPSRGWTFAPGILWRRPGTAKRSTLHGTAPSPTENHPHRTPHSRPDEGEETRLGEAPGL